MADRKVSVDCKNPLCKKYISPIKRRNNTHGRSEYCSRDCYYDWSPGMAATFYKIVRLKGIAQPEDPKKFMRDVLVETMNKFTTWTARASVLGVKRQTYIRWCSHFKVPIPKKGHR